LRIHERPASDVSGNEASMSGKAMFTIVTSRNPMKTATDVTSRTFQRFFTERTLSGVRCVMKRAARAPSVV
jgi:hypothetical protein